MKLFGQRIGPEFTLYIKRQVVAFHVRMDREAARRDARLESADGLGEIFLQLIQVRRGLAAKLAHAEIDDRAKSLRIIFQVERLQTLDRETGLCVKQPLKIAKDATPILLMRDDPLISAFLGFGGLVIRETIEEAGLKFFYRIRHLINEESFLTLRGSVQWSDIRARSNHWHQS